MSADPADEMAQAKAQEDAELVDRAVIALARAWGVTEQVARLRLAGSVLR